MFIPNNKALLSTWTGSNMYGEPEFSDPLEVPCGVVRLSAAARKTSVRADSSASRGNSDETVSSGKVLFPGTIDIEIGSKLEINGQMHRIYSVEPRYALTGALDHHECLLEAWVD